MHKHSGSFRDVTSHLDMLLDSCPRLSGLQLACFVMLSCSKWP